jgi:uncharacterized phage protein (TIGR02220 family)
MTGKQIIKEIKELQSEIKEVKQVLLEYIESRKPKVVKDEKIEEVREIINYFNEVTGRNFRESNGLITHIRGRLRSFSKEEIKQAIRGYHQVSKDEPDFWRGKNFTDNIHSLMASDAKLEKWMMYHNNRMKRQVGKVIPLKYD